MRIGLADLLVAIRESYREQVMPHVADPVARSFAGAVASLLDQVSHRLEHEEAGLLIEIAQLEELLGSGGDEAPPAAGESPTLARIETLGARAEALRAQAVAIFAGRYDAPGIRRYMRDQLDREARLYATRPDDRVL